MCSGRVSSFSPPCDMNESSELVGSTNTGGCNEGSNNFVGFKWINKQPPKTLKARNQKRQLTPRSRASPCNSPRTSSTHYTLCWESVSTCCGLLILVGDERTNECDVTSSALAHHLCKQHITSMSPPRLCGIHGTDMHGMKSSIST